MYFDFDGRYDSHEPIGGTIRRWDGLLLSVVVHALLVALALLAPALPFLERDLAALEEEAARAEAARERERERPRFVFVQPRVDFEAARPPERAEASDQDRTARNVAPVPAPANPLPFARGNSAERVEAAPEERARGRGPDPEPRAAEPETRAEALPPAERSPLPVPQQQPPQPAGGSLGEALRNLQRYVDQESFSNPQGNVQDLGPLQFDTMGVEFGPWIRRFVAQVRRNWFIPYAAMTMRGRVVLTFNVHRNGALTDVQIVQPSPVDSFNTAARNALIASNPTEPLPPDYPADKAFFTVTFYYNETPGQ